MSYEILGTLASVLVLISFLMRGEKRIRIINIVGALLFVIYGILINAFSVWFLNSALILIHLYYLTRK
jgi:hypothetical protein